MQLFLHQNQFGICVVPDPFPPRAGDVIHPVHAAVGKGSVHQTNELGHKPKEYRTEEQEERTAGGDTGEQAMHL